MGRLLNRGFGPAEKSVDWAHSAATDLQTELEDFFRQLKADPAVTEIDPQTGDCVTKQRFPRLPNATERRANEALQNARNAFDQTLNAGLAILRPARKEEAHFPWADSPGDLAKRLVKKAIPQELWPAIESQEPYKRSDAYPGGDDLIRAMATVANQKHTIGLAIWPEVALGIGPTGSDPMHLDGQIELLGSNGWDPVKQEVEILRVPRGSKFKCKYALKVEVILDEARLPEPMNAVRALDLFTANARRFLDDVKAVCT